MKVLRHIVQWIDQHRLISYGSAVVLVALLIGMRFISRRSEGALSDPVRRGVIVESVYGIGTVMANRSYQLKLGIVGQVRELYVKEGDKVKKGDRLTKVEDIVYYAPFAGTVTSVPFKVGENAFVSSTVVSVVDFSDRYMVVSLEQQGTLRVEAGQKVKMSFDSMRENSYDGGVKSVYANDNNFWARIDVGHLPSKILPGMTADVAIEINRHENALLVPVAALEQGKSLWVKKGHALAKQIFVETGIVDGAFVEVTKGDIAPGDRVLIRNK